MARIAVVTGASAGIGREMAVSLAREGFEPMLVARRADKLAETAAAVKAAGGKAHLHTGDVNDEGAADRALTAAKKLGDVEALLNNAGFGMYGAFAEHDRADLRRMIDTNVRSLTDWTHVFLDHFLAKKTGRILNVASTAAMQPMPFNSAYCASKAYVLSFGESLAEELRGSGVTLTTLCPGMTESEFFATGNYASKAGMIRVPKFAMMTSARVAAIGVRGMLRGRTVVIAGWYNNAGALGAKLTPHRLSAKLVSAAMRPRKRT